MLNPELSAITQLFKIEGSMTAVKPYGSGHINTTYLSEWVDGGVRKRFVHQQINEKVFKDIPGLISNIGLVLSKLREKQIPGYADLELIPAKSGAFFVRDAAGNPWRTLNFIEDTVEYETCPDERIAGESGRILGAFQAALVAIDLKRITAPIPHFTSAVKRLQDFKAALANSRRDARPETEFVLANQVICDLVEEQLSKGLIPERVIHGDPKLNNFLFNKDTGRAACLIDLDTCMPAYSLYDAADLIRNVSVESREDEQDFSKVIFNLNYYRAILSGYAQHARAFLVRAEIDLLPRVPQLLAYTLGMRFLTDYLNGDKYFKVARATHNLERARTQFKIFELFKANEEKMRKMSESLFL